MPVEAAADILAVLAVALKEDLGAVEMVVKTALD
jgi:hypothetical protein